MDVVVLQQQQVLQPRPDMLGGCRVEHRQRDEDHGPIRGQDAQGAAAQVDGYLAGPAPGQRGRRPPSVEQQAREREEDRDADVTPAEHPGNRCAGQRVAGQAPDMSEQYRGGRRGAEPVQRALVRGRGEAGGR